MSIASRYPSGLNVCDLGLYVVRPTLDYLGMGGPVAEALMLGTAAQESGFRHLVQEAGGPALGLWQMEPDTHDDIFNHWLSYRPQYSSKIQRLLSPFPILPAAHLIANLHYACAMARLAYFRSSWLLPSAIDLPALAYGYKLIYNTPAGKATEAEWIDNYQRLVAPYWM